MYFVMLCAMFLAGTIAYLFSIEPVSIDIIEVEMTEDDYLDPSWESNMLKFHAMNDWGIFVSNDEVLNGTVERSKLEEAEYKLIHPYDGFIYFDNSGEYLKADKPFWFLPIQQPALFESFYEGLDDIAAEVEPLYPEVFFTLSVAERLCKANITSIEGEKHDELSEHIVYTICEEGVCPVCGGELEYTGCREDDDNGCAYPWTCSKCNATGEEGYTIQFDGNHYDVVDGDGKPVKILAPQIKAAEPATNNAPAVSAAKAVEAAEDACPVCGGRLEYTGNSGEKKYGIRQEWECSHCHAVGWANYEEETSYTFTGEHEDIRLADGSEWNGHPVWKIPVVWEMKGFLYVSRPTLEEAMDAVHNDVEDFPLPEYGAYLDGSFDLDCYDEDYIRECFNSGMADSPEAVDTETP